MRIAIEWLAALAMCLCLGKGFKAFQCRAAPTPAGDYSEVLPRRKPLMSQACYPLREKTRLDYSLCAAVAEITPFMARSL